MFLRQKGAKMQAVLTFALTQTRRFLRDPVSLFFTILFPLIFLFVFGTIFGNNNNISFNIGVVNHSETDFAKEFVSQFSDDGQPFKVKEVADLADAKEKMSHNELDSIIELPADFGAVKGGAACADDGAARTNPDCLPSGQLNVYYDPASAQTGQTVADVVGGVLDKINSGMTGVKPPLTVAQVSTGQAGLKQFDYTFAGLLAMTLMTMSIFGLSNQFPTEKKTGAMRRIQVTPFRPWQMIVGMIMAYTVLTVISITCMLVVGITMFHFEMRGDWLTFGLFALLGTLVMSGIGAIISGWARNENQSAPIAQLVAFPMMFLSGIFFPRYLMPDWLQGVTNWVPLTPVGDGLRFIIADGANLLAILPQIGLVAAWGVAAYLVAFKVFRWE
jgi:ABC-2 type transport system permease protein